MKLAKREKYFVSIAASVIVSFFLLQFAILPFFEKRKSVETNIKRMEKEIKEMTLLSNEYRTLKQAPRDIQKLLSRRKSGFTLFSFLEQAAGDAQVKDHIEYMKPSISENTGTYKESLVEMKLKELNLKQLITYLKYIESPEDLIIVKRMSIQGNKKKPGYMDVVLQVLTFQV